MQASTSPERSFKIKCFLSNQDPATTRPFHWRLDKYPFGQVRWTFPHCHPKEIHWQVAWACGSMPIFAGPEAPVRSHGAMGLCIERLLKVYAWCGIDSFDSISMIFFSDQSQSPFLILLAWCILLQNLNSELISMRIHSVLEICSRDFMQSFDFCFTVTVTLCAGDVDSGVLKQRNNLLWPALWLFTAGDSSPMWNRFVPRHFNCVSSCPHPFLILWAWCILLQNLNCELISMRMRSNDCTSAECELRIFVSPPLQGHFALGWMLTVELWSNFWNNLLRAF